MTTLGEIWSTYETAHLPRLAPKTQAAYRHQQIGDTND